MQPNFNINRPKVSDEEIERHKNFDQLVAQFKKQSIKQARGDESWWKNKKIQYSAVIMGITVVCTVTYLSLNKKQNTTTAKHDKITTSRTTEKNTSPAPFVASHLPKLNKKATVYTVNNQKGAALKHASSTAIKVPARSFVDRKGKEIVGDVTIEYREFDHLADVIAAGIPMAHDSLSKPYQLESAGMFEIKASSQGEQVFVSPDRPLRVELASRSTEPRFVQYYLDTNSRNWRYLGPDREIMPLAKKGQPLLSASSQQELQREIEVVIPRQADSVRSAYNSRIGKVRAPAAPARPARNTKGRPNFSLEGSYEEFPELKAFNNVLFEVGPENRNYSPEFHDITWSDVKIGEGPVKGKNYLLTLSHRQRREQLIVYPVLTGRDYDEALVMYEKKLAAYKELAEKKEQERQKLVAELEKRQEELQQRAREKEASLSAIRAQVRAAKADDSGFDGLSDEGKALRVFKVVNMGIYNSDCPHSTADARQLLPSYVTSGNNTPLHPEQVFLINHSIKSVTRTRQGLSIMPGNDYSICALAGGKLYICDKATFKKSSGQKTFTIALTEQPGAMENIQDLRKALDI